MDRPALIEAALAKRNFSSVLAPRFERLLDGVEDRSRLRCCNSGCYVCVKLIHAVLDEVEAGLSARAQASPAAAAGVTATSCPGTCSAVTAVATVSATAAAPLAP